MMATTTKHQVVKIRVTRYWESCERTTFYVELETDEGFTMQVAGYATGSVYTNHEGLSVGEARDRALIDAADWGDFLGIEPEPYADPSTGQFCLPSMTFDKYSNQRAMAEKRLRNKV